MRLSEGVKNASLLAVVLVACLLLAEFLFAIFGISALNEVSSYRQKDNAFHHSFVPNSSAIFRSSEWEVSYNINSMGFRDREYSVGKPANTFRILMLGDSYTEGYGVEASESFSEQLESMLNANSTTRYEVINAGVGSYSPIIEYLVLREKGLKLDPDLVILNFDWSDPNDDYMYSKFAVMEGSKLIAVNAEPESVKPSSAKLRDFLSRRSRVYQYFARQFASVTSEITPGVVGSDRLIFMRDNLTDEDYAALFRNSEPYLLAMAGLLTENNISFAIHTYPYALQISPDAWKSGRATFKFGSDKVYPDKPFEIMEEFGKSNNITVVSSYSAFKSHPDPARLYFDYDGHFTPEGHKIAAQVLYDFVKN